MEQDEHRLEVFAVQKQESDTLMVRDVVAVAQRPEHRTTPRPRHDWKLTLSCGHVTYRAAGAHWQRPAPKRVYCSRCYTEAHLTK
ncbi:MAG: hypothetical protein HC828_01945 [Blastochloris sp.]|nr:hypothetical protein [Blastochloris sp.]